MAWNLDSESSSFWKVWKRGTHAQICAEILGDDEFHAQAAAEIVEEGSHGALVAKVVRMTGRRIGQELARKAGSRVERSIYQDAGSVFSAMEEGSADSLTAAVKGHAKVAEILAKKDPELVDELVFMTSRMVGRAVGKKLAISFDNISTLGKEILKRIF